MTPLSFILSPLSFILSPFHLGGTAPKNDIRIGNRISGNRRHVFHERLAQQRVVFEIPVQIEAQVLIPAQIVKGTQLPPQDGSIEIGGDEPSDAPDVFFGGGGSRNNGRSYSETFRVSV